MEAGRWFMGHLGEPRISDVGAHVCLAARGGMNLALPTGPCPQPSASPTENPL